MESVFAGGAWVEFPWKNWGGPGQTFGSYQRVFHFSSQGLLPP